MLHMPEWGVEKNGVVVISDCLFYCLIDRTIHHLIVLAIRELPDYQSADIRQHPTHPQTAHHAVDMIMPLAYILNQKQRFGRGLRTENGRVRKWRSLKAVQNRQVSADEHTFRFPGTVERMTLPFIMQLLAG